MAKVVVVDDEAEVYNLVRLALEQAGHQVEVADSGRTAFSVLEKARPDIAIIDQRMPYCNGVELCFRIRQTDWGKRIRLIIMSGDPALEHGEGDAFKAKGLVDDWCIKGGNFSKRILKLIPEGGV